jgi:tetratricopeptide (TPR) repeat protein
MNSDTGQGVALMANSDYGILVAEEFLRSLAKEYNWKYKPRPRSEFLKLELVGKVQGVDAMLAKYDQLKTSNDAKNRPEEPVLNGIGYDYLRAGKMDDTIRIFQKNVAEFPESSNVYDSLGEAYAAAGKKELAIENYGKSLKLDPKNRNAIERLEKLKESQ